MGALLLLLGACAGRDPGLPEGRWTLEGEGVLGELRVEGGESWVGLWGATWGTPAAGSPAETGRDEASERWIAFPVGIAAGEATAELALDVEAGRARLPLGYRPGELEFALLLREGALEPARAAEAAGGLAVALPALQEAWAHGGFQLRDRGGALAGQLEILPEGRARAEILTPWALTEGATQAVRQAEGPDQVFLFEVEPRFAEEQGLLRLNLPTLQAVLPVDRLPHPDDRWLRVSPGLPSAEERSQRREEVRTQALVDERALLARLAPALAAAADERRAASGRCPAFGELDMDWQTLLGDYRIRIEPQGSGCQVRLEPSTVQHTRRTALSATAAGLGPVEVLGP